MILYEHKGDSVYAKEGHHLSCMPHLHHHLELVYMKKGSVLVEVDNVQYTLQAGDALFVFPNQLHLYYNAQPIVDDILIISPDEFPDFINLFRSDLPSCPVIREAGDEIASLFDRCCAAAQQESPYHREVLRGYALALIGTMLPQMELIHHEALDLSMAQKILLHCDRHYTEPLTLDSLAARFGISKYYISHLFSEKVGMGFSQYINRLRIGVAKRYLATSDKSITDISDLSGYSSIRSFNRQFIQLAGCSPTEYRRKKQG